MTVIYSENANFEKPTVGNSNDTWGTELNKTIDLIDGAILSNNFAQDTLNTTGLNFYYKNGRIMNGKTIVKTSAGYVTLTNNTTNYVEVNSSGTVSVNQVGFTTGYIPLYQIDTLSGAINTITDSRAYLYPNISEKIKVDSSGNIIIGDSSNYTKCTSEGLQSMTGTARVKRILRLNAGDIKDGSSSPSPVVLGDYLMYNYGINDNAYTSISIPEDLDTSGTIDIYAIWCIGEAYSTNSAEIKWRIDWSLSAIGEVASSPGNSGDNDTGDINIPSTSYTLVRTLLVSISYTDIAANDILGIKVSRIALTGGNNPTAEPGILGLDIEYTSNKLGKSL